MALLLRRLFSLAALGCAAAQNAYLFPLDTTPSVLPSQRPSIDSDTANAILARRMDVTASQFLGQPSASSLDALDLYGGHSQSLLGLRASPVPSGRVHVVIEGFDGDMWSDAHALIVERPDTDLGDVPYMRSSGEEEQSPYIACRKGYLPLDSGVHVKYAVTSEEGECVDGKELLQALGADASISDGVSPNQFTHLMMAQGAANGALIKIDATRLKGSGSGRNADILAMIRSWYTALQQSAASGTIESTLLVVPSRRAPPPLKLSSREIHSDKEEEPPLGPLASATEAHAEELLSSPSTSDDSDSLSSSSSSSSSNSLPPLGSLLPSCFASNRSCNDRTNSCSGHGSCYAKSSQCFACRCGSTIVRQDSDGKNAKTVYWGGSACERKDVSVPFFLLAGFAVTMTAMVAGGVGMLYGMGSQQLPSVIGAGVTGPRPQR